MLTPITGVAFLLLSFSANAAPVTANRSTIDSAIKKNIDSIRTCYAKTDKRQHHTLEGKVVINFFLGADGKAEEAKVASTTLKHEKIETCILNIIKGIKFPKPNGKFISVSYPFTFSPADEKR